MHVQQEHMHQGVHTRVQIVRQEHTTLVSTWEHVQLALRATFAGVRLSPQHRVQPKEIIVLEALLQKFLVQHAQQHSMSLRHAQGQAIDNVLPSQFVILRISTRHRLPAQLKTDYA